MLLLDKVQRECIEEKPNPNSPHVQTLFLQGSERESSRLLPGFSTGAKAREQVGPRYKELHNWHSVSGAKS